MAEIMAAGVTHHPGFLGPDENMAVFLRQTLKTDKVPAYLKDSSHWPGPMRAEWGNDGGVSAAKTHRQRIWDDFRKVRSYIDSFQPDFVLVWGDDQYEQFTEECIPPFNVFILDEIECQPYLRGAFSPGAKNVWSEPADKVFRWRGHREGASYLTQRLMERNFDISYAYRLRESGVLSHSFLNTLLYLDWDRTGFNYPVVPFHVNCYGSTIVRSRGGLGHLTGPGDQAPDPSGPSPQRCSQLGRETARILRESPWRVALIASSSWSHAFLTEKNHWIYPDTEADRRLLQDLKDCRYERFGQLTLEEVTDSGQHEILNWVCLAGALSELNYRPHFVDFVESYIFNSDKCMAVFLPPARQEA